MDLKSEIIARALAAGILMLGLTASANAATFGVRVVDEAGTPVTGASVCFGLPGNYKQFGALFTDAEGQVMLDVPNIPFVVTVSKTRFSGVRINEPARGFNLVKQVVLADGSPGPRCKAGSTLADTDNSSVQILRADVDSNGNSMSISAIATGNPTEYRLSESTDFRLSRWQDFSTSVAVPAAMTDLNIIYLQMRRYANTQNGWLEALSPVVSVLLPFTSEES